ncbi:hypothetical protein Lal_00005045 [Lupinus albus]|nr:hypothetical protein Lal_00005045 [Lupinus albus]
MGSDEKERGSEKTREKIGEKTRENAKTKRIRFSGILLRFSSPLTVTRSWILFNISHCTSFLNIIGLLRTHLPFDNIWFIDAENISNSKVMKIITSICNKLP